MGKQRGSRKERAEPVKAEAAAALKEPLPPDHALFKTSGEPLEIAYRQFMRETITGDLKHPRLRGIQIDGRLAVIYSPEDLSTGLVGQPVDGIAGYEPKTAVGLMASVLTNANGK